MEKERTQQLVQDRSGPFGRALDLTVTDSVPHDIGHGHSGPMAPSAIAFQRLLTDCKLVLDNESDEGEGSPASEVGNVVPQERHTDGYEERVGNNAQKAEVTPLQKQVSESCSSEDNTALLGISPQEKVFDCAHCRVSCDCHSERAAA